jgi:AcrR family transcriptional regulator
VPALGFKRSFDQTSGQSFANRTAHPLNAPHFSTKERILGAAETLFARHGFAGASLRQVTAAAHVNLAAVNYHFGSKDNLIEEVFRRRLDELNARRLDALKNALDKAEPDLEGVLSAFIRPALDLSLDQGGGHAFMRVLARAYAEHDERLRRFLSDNYGHVLREFAAAFGRLLPHLEKEELYWRLDFITGALTHSMADFGPMKRRSQVSEESHRERAAEHLIRFAVAGLLAR